MKFLFGIVGPPHLITYITRNMKQKHQKRAWLNDMAGTHQYEYLLCSVQQQSKIYVYLFIVSHPFLKSKIQNETRNLFINRKDGQKKTLWRKTLLKKCSAYGNLERQWHKHEHNHEHGAAGSFAGRMKLAPMLTQMLV